MKKKFIYSFVIASFLMVSCSEQSNSSTETSTTTSVEQTQTSQQIPAIKFDETEFNFGEITQGDTVEHVFTFTNTGNAPLMIYSATAGCGCTIPEFEKDRPILPNEKGSIKVKFNSTGKSGIQTKEVSIATNVSDTKEIVTIKGEVKIP